MTSMVFLVTRQIEMTLRSLTAFSTGLLYLEEAAISGAQKSM